MEKLQYVHYNGRRFSLKKKSNPFSLYHMLQNRILAQLSFQGIVESNENNINQCQTKKLSLTTDKKCLVSTPSSFLVLYNCNPFNKRTSHRNILFVSEPPQQHHNSYDAHINKKHISIYATSIAKTSFSIYQINASKSLIHLNIFPKERKKGRKEGKLQIFNSNFLFWQAKDNSCISTSICRINISFMQKERKRSRIIIREVFNISIKQFSSLSSLIVNAQVPSAQII